MARKLVTKDVFKVARIIKSGNLKDSLIEINENKEGKNAEQVGMEIIMSLIEGCAEQEKALYEFLGSALEKTPEEVENEPIEELILDLKELAKENDLISFFKTAQNVTK